MLRAHSAESRKALVAVSSENKRHVRDSLQQLSSNAHAEAVRESKPVEDLLEEVQAELAATQMALEQALETIDKVRDAALHDQLTGLPNRELFIDRLRYALALSSRRGWDLAVIFLDLDGFKLINDTLGHAAGDEVLKTIASRLSKKLRFADTVGRYGGDEFVLLLLNPQGRENVALVADKVLDEIRKPIAYDQEQLRVGASLGISLCPEQAADDAELVKLADAAMYTAKKSRKHIVFS